MPNHPFDIGRLQMPHLLRASPQSSVCFKRIAGQEALGGIAIPPWLGTAPQRNGFEFPREGEPPCEPALPRGSNGASHSRIPIPISLEWDSGQRRNTTQGRRRCTLGRDHTSLSAPERSTPSGLAGGNPVGVRENSSGRDIRNRPPTQRALRDTGLGCVMPSAYRPSPRDGDPETDSKGYGERRTTTTIARMDGPSTKFSDYLRDVMALRIVSLEAR